MNKKILCLALSLLMVLTIVPAQAFAWSSDSLVNSLSSLSSLQSLKKNSFSWPTFGESYTVYYTDSDGFQDSVNVRSGARINFITDGHASIESIYVDEETYIDDAVSEDEGYEFVGWTYKRNFFTGNYVFTAVWDAEIIDVGTPYYNIGYLDYETGESTTAAFKKGTTIYVSANGGIVNAYKQYKQYSFNVTTACSIENPEERDGYEFKGWEVDKVSSSFVTFTAQWDSTGTCKVKYKALDETEGLVEKELEVAKGEEIVVYAYEYNDNGEIITGTFDEGQTSIVFEANNNIELDEPTAPEHTKFNGYTYTTGFGIEFQAHYVPETFKVDFKGYVSDTESTVCSIDVAYGKVVVVDPNGGTYNRSGMAANLEILEAQTIGIPTSSYADFAGWECVYSEYYGNYTLTAKWVSNGNYPQYDECDKSAAQCIIANCGDDDLSTTAWYHDGVHFCLQNKVMAVTEYGFLASTAVTREEVIKSLYVLANGGDAATVEYEVAAAWVVEQGIFNGQGEAADAEFNYLNPADQITREQFATVLCRYIEAEAGSTASGETLTFKDAVKIAAFARNSVKWAVSENILQGVGNNTFNPKGIVTRAELATVLVRVYEFSDALN